MTFLSDGWWFIAVKQCGRCVWSKPWRSLLRSTFLVNDVNALYGSHTHIWDGEGTIKQAGGRWLPVHWFMILTKLILLFIFYCHTLGSMSWVGVIGVLVPLKVRLHHPGSTNRLCTAAKEHTLLQQSWCSTHVKFHCNDQSGELPSSAAPLLALPACKLNSIWLISTLNFFLQHIFKPNQIMNCGARLEHEEMEFWFILGSINPIW